MILDILKTGVCAIACLTLSLTATAQEKKQPDPEKVFARLDQNKDGNLSLEEFTTVKRKKEVSIEILTKRFNRMDNDKDKTVTLEEFKAFIKKRTEAKASKQ
jgi:Ca2+-binding EF-hand superfamily protein